MDKRPKNSKTRPKNSTFKPLSMFENPGRGPRPTPPAPAADAYDFTVF